MKTPPESARADDERPPFETLEPPEDLLQGERTRDDYLSVALQLREPTSIPEIAERADRGTDSAREYMRFLETIGLVRRVSDDPERYETNRAYLYWRRVDDIRQTHTDSEIVARLQAVLDEIGEFEERYGTSDPEDVELVEAADERDARVEAIWDERSRWQTLLARRSLLEDALDHEPEGYDTPASGESDESASQAA